MDVVDETGNVRAYYEQFETAAPVVGKEYKTGKGTWQEFTYKIVYIGEGVALGVCTGTKECGTFSVGDKKLFHAEGFRSGWAYKDDRSVYRLQE